MMKRTDPMQLGDVMRQALEQYHIDGRLLEVRAASLWPRIVGPKVAAETEAAFVEEGVMKVRVPSAALRHELNMQRSRFISIINRTLGADVLSEIRFLS